MPDAAKLPPIAEMPDGAVDAELHALTLEAGPEERRVLLYQARRLVALGQRDYDKLDLANDRRDFREMKAEELSDFLDYGSFEFIRRQVTQR